MTNEIEQGLHEKLCAYVLGEASEDVRREVEKALAESAELRAERARLEETIGLVQQTLRGGESLPEGSASEILADARAAARRPWYTRPAFRAAAGIAAATLLGVIGYRARVRSDASPLSGAIASVHQADGSGAKMKSLGYAEELRAAPAERQDAPTVESKESAGAPAAAPIIFAQSASRGTGAGGQVIDSTTLGRLDKKSEATESEFQDSFDPSQATESSSPETAEDRKDSVAGATSIGVGSPGSAKQIVAGRPSAFASRRMGIGAIRRSSELKSEDDRSAPLTNMMGDGKALKGFGYVGDSDGVADSRIVDSSDLSIIDRLRQLDPADRDKWIDDECQRIVRRCRRLPNEKPRDMFFRFYGDNPFEISALDPLSTFSVDVDTASYTLARRYLREGHIPEKAQVRTEEFVNYFKADVAAPTKGVFAIHTDLAPSRFSGDKARWMLRVVVRGKDVSKQDRKPLNLTFVIDVSGSMREQNRLEMVKHAIRLLVTELGGGDNVAIVAFSNDARVVLPMTSVRDRSAIESALFPLEPENSTNSESGLKLGYSIALANINPEAQNRVVFLSDGVANVGETDPAKLSESVKPIREKGVYLNTIGVGMNNHNDTLLEQLADKGDGVCNYIDSPDEAKHVIVDGFTGTFETIARDVKVQVEFDPAQVERYRLLGYENRAIADKDFRNDKIDAGEVGAGHQVTALYELELATSASEKPLATVRLRYKAPRSVSAPTANEEATEISEPVLASRKTIFEGAGFGYRRAVIVAQFAEFLRRSVHARGESLDDLIVEAEKLEKESKDPEIGELVVLLHQSKQLILNALPACDDLCQTIETLRRHELLRCEHERLANEQDKQVLADLEKQNSDLEQRIRELLRKRIEERVK